MSPAVSVVMPVRDGERFLREALASTLAQTLDDIEVIVVDDGSTDTTAAILGDVARIDSRVRVLRQDARGLAPALNAGCEEARAPLIARMDADDVMLPGRLAAQAAYLEAHPRVALLGGGIVLVDAAGTEVDSEPGSSSLELLERNALVHATVVMRTEAYRSLGGYRLDQAEDYDLWLRFDERFEVAALRELVLRYRLHPGQFSVTALERQALGALCVRAAAIARRGGAPDPLEGVTHLDAGVAERLGVGRAAVDRAVVSDAVHWAATLGRVGRDGEAGALLDAAAQVPGAPGRRALARDARLVLLKRALRHGRIPDGLRAAAAYARGR
jgi:glycosyltransferase involved in cell wall biosynthesis